MKFYAYIQHNKGYIYIILLKTNNSFFYLYDLIPHMKKRNYANFTKLV